MPIIYCERHGETYNSNEDADYDIRKDNLKIRMATVEKHWMAALDGIVEKHGGIDASRCSVADFVEKLKLEIGGYVSDSFGDVCGISDLVNAMEIE